MLLYFVAFLVAILILVTIHEWGHYWVAKRAGVTIEKFSIGFGAPLCSWKNRAGTEFCLAMIPLGGYVKMKGEYAIATSEAQTAAQQGSFAAMSVYKRMAIVAAGPVVNLLFAAAIFAYFSYGTVKLPAALIAQPHATSIFAQLDIRDGAEVRAVNQTEIHSYGQMQNVVLDALLSQKPIVLTWRDDQGQEHTGSPISTREVSLDNPKWQEQVGLALYQPTALIGHVLPDSPAAKAGLKKDDQLIGVNGHKATGNVVLNTIHGSPEKPVTLMVQRQTEQFSIDIIPQAHTLPATQPTQEPIVVGRVGVEVANNVKLNTEQRGIIKALTLGVSTTVEQMGLNLKGLYKVVTGQLSVKNIGGPVTIARQAGESAKGGITQFISFLAVLSVVLGTMNLLPIPVLDGGHLLYYTAELIRGRPLPERMLVLGQKMGLALLLLLMSIALFNDAHWLF